ncbi:MAG: hypothetical protein HN704_00935 [Bacteroidetes bacterium]|jgi:hypothetical protein|nr:hypothetical protein [Bacteroidota bacterium]MBT6685555.1 hypothetical protein [Bacteroidota bacterium]MBT7142265.1 hypothetical protein [Bacteroidota bacterium]MBT7490149.1 hypothetical protein [Bacteroidota bacterium]
MERRMSVAEMMTQLKNETINTWFDLGLFIDKFKETKPIPSNTEKGTFTEFILDIQKGGLAFVSFYYSIDGVTIEVNKYANVLSNSIENIPIHYIAGQFFPEADKLLGGKKNRLQIDEIKGFGDWDLYEDFFSTKLERGSKEYNALILKYWKQVLGIVEKLGSYIENNNIKLLYLINTNSNPGNVSLALATVLVSEYLGIPVINNNHDFYWEGGNRKIDIETRKIKEGPRDFFYTNSDIGEFFSQIDVLFPWESRTWMNVNINQNQCDELIEVKGHNPANIAQIGTAIDITNYMNITKREKLEAFKQFEKIFSRYEETLVSYSVNDAIEHNLIDLNNLKPILLGNKTKSISKFLAENIIFLQPTRIVSRKRIGTGFRLIQKLLNNPQFVSKFTETKHFKLTLLVTGPIPTGQFNYFENLLKKFADLLASIKPEYREKIFLGFLFSELDKKSFKSHFEQPIAIPELYNIASLIILGSKTEGRGLPIIEAAAGGIPIFCTRYDPEHVYAEVIGEHLPEEDRLKVIEFDGVNISPFHVSQIVDRIFFPHKFIEEIKHNKKVVLNRYSIDNLKENLFNIIYRLYFQLKDNTNSMKMVKKVMAEYSVINNFSNEDLESIINTKNRHFLPGYGRLKFLGYLKSLIDPSFFRLEFQNIRGIAMDFANDLIESNPQNRNFSNEKIYEFYNSVDNIFNYHDGEFEIKHDHSFSYRHRNTIYYPYQEYTIQELTGIINLLYSEIFQSDIKKVIDQSSHFFTDWNLALSQLTSASEIPIDDRKRLVQKLKSNVPIAYFAGKYVLNELEFFALQSIRARLKLPFENELTEDIIKSNANNIEPVYIFANKKYLAKWPSAESIKHFILDGKDKELKLLYEYEVIRIVTTNQLSVGIHFAQLGADAIKKLKEVRDKNGFIISTRRSSTYMTDIVDIDRFHVGHIHDDISANIMGIPKDSGYVFFIPAGVRTTLAYPTPIQTAKEFHDCLKSEQFKNLAEKYGEAELFKLIKKDAEENSSPIKTVLENLQNKDVKAKDVEYNFVSGVYKDGNPWNGINAKVNIANSNKKWNFVTMESPKNTKRVTAFVEEFNKFGAKAKIAWNGGYILNPELVGKLGLPESYIGSPLGLMISNKIVKSTPLFNKPALLIYEDGRLDIKRVNVANGISISCKTRIIDFPSENYNLDDTRTNLPDFCYYDLMYDKEIIEGNGRTIVRLAGNVIKEVIFSKRGEKVNVVPTGLTLSIAEQAFPAIWDSVDKELDICINGLEGIEHAVEAGPLLVNNNKFCLDMETEGWKTNNSIITQAARLDYTDMRGPKIAVGIDKKGNLIVLTINGRIRESVGATHIDMAEILLKFGIEKAMGFDPGGSSTLVVGDKTLNISPYNSQYERNIYALPPEPRAVANAVIGYVEK